MIRNPGRMLSEEDIRYLAAAVAARMGNQPQNWFAAWVPNQAFLGNLNYQPTPVDTAMSAVRMAAQGSGQRYPGALDGIFAGLAPAADPKTEEIHQKVKRYQAVFTPAGGNTLDALLLAHGPTFWDRTELRDSVARLLPAAGRSLLVVNGDPGTGKSHTVQLLTHLELTGGTFVLASVRPPIMANTASEETPEHLAEEIVVAMLLKPDLDNLPKREGLTANKFCDRLCGWVLGHIVSGNANSYWIVLDGLGLAGVDGFCRTFITSLAYKVTASAWQGRIRLILLNYPAADLLAMEDHLETEDIAFDPPGKDKIKEVAKAALTLHGQSFNDSDLDAIADDVLGRVAVRAGDISYCREVNRRVRQVLGV